MTAPTLNTGVVAMPMIDKRANINVPAPPAAVMTAPDAVSPHDERKRFFAVASGAHCWACWATEVTAC